MFEYNDKTGDITAIQGNSGVLETTPFNAETEEKIILDENDKILFCIKTPSGRTVIKKILTYNDYDENGKLVLTFTPTEMLLQVFTYRYGFTYIPNDGAEAQTYAQGNFIVINSCGTVEDIAIDTDIDIVPDTNNPIEGVEKGEINGND